MREWRTSCCCGGAIPENNAVLRYTLEETTRELDSAIWFISLLTRVDGLVLMNPHLEVKGFGVEITFSDPVENVYRSRTENATQSALKKIDYNHFGTRHRSMMRYCAQIPESIGFVVSQDGDVRIITQVNGQLVIWENIKLQRHINARRRQIKRKKIIEMNQANS